MGPVYEIEQASVRERWCDMGERKAPALPGPEDALTEPVAKKSV
jgi:hypothetical protein